MEVQTMILLDQRVRRLNEKAFTRVEHEAFSYELPVEDPNVVWSALCDRAFLTLKRAVADEVHEENILPHVPSVLDRLEFETAVQDRYKRFARVNMLEKRVKNAEMELKQAGKRNQQASARAADQREAWEQQMNAQTTEHSKHLAQLEENLRQYHRLFRETDYTHTYSLKEQRSPEREVRYVGPVKPALTTTGTSSALPPPPTAPATTTATPTRPSPQLPPATVMMWKAATQTTAILWKVAKPAMVMIWKAATLLLTAGLTVLTVLVRDSYQGIFDIIQEKY